MKRILKLRRLWILVCIPVSVCLLLLSKNTDFADGYAQTVYPALCVLIGGFSSLFSFSLAELLLFLFLAAILFLVVFFIVRVLCIKKDRGFRTAKFFVNAGCILSVLLLLLLFTFLCGINYGRSPYAVSDEKGGSTEELSLLCDELTETLNTLELPLQAPTTEEMLQTAKKSMEALTGMQGVLPKAVLLSRGMSYLNITGIFFPFTLEANVNTDIPAFDLPNTMCHELAHRYGYMREGEANYMAYLACRDSGDAFFTYSGTLCAFLYVNSALYAKDSAAAVEKYRNLSDRVWDDLLEREAYWKQFDGFAADFSESLNDAYLKVNGQEDGVESYGDLVDLLLADFRARHFGEKESV